MTTVTMKGVSLALDDHGQVAQLHGLGIQCFGGTYYAYGENKANGNRFQGVACYTSDDLAHWRSEGIVLGVRESGLLAADTIAERPKVLRCPSTGEYVMYIHTERGDYNYAHIGVAVADNPLGPFRFLFSMQPFGNISRDIGVFQDEDGAGYLISEDREHGTHIYRLSGDYHSVVEDVACERGTNYEYGYESPTIIRHEGLYYWFGSQLTGWNCNDNMFATATDLHGPWSEPRTLVEQDPAHKLYGTGHHNIVNIPGTDEWIIAYHRFAYNPAGRWSGGDGCHRETVFAPLNHNADGTLEPVRPQTGSYIRPLNF